MLTLLRGLSGKFHHIVSNLKMQCPFLTFEEACTMLLLEEIDINDAAIKAPPVALLAFIWRPTSTYTPLLVAAPVATTLALGSS